MRALFSRLHRSHKEKDSSIKDLERDKSRLAATEKNPQAVVIPPALKTADYGTTADQFAPSPVSSELPDRKPRVISQHGIHRKDGDGPRPPSQFELSLHKPLPDITPQTSDDERVRSSERVREPSQSTTISSAPASSRARDPHDSQGRSTTLSKQSQSTHLNSVSTDNTSLSGDATPQGNVTSPTSGGAKKVAFISPPPTPGDMSATAPLPNPLPGPSHDADGHPRTSSSSHAHSHSLSKATSFPNGPSGAGGVGPGDNAAASASATNLSTKNGRVTSTSQAPGKVNASKDAPKAASVSAARAATSPIQSQQTNFNALGTYHPGGSAARLASRADFAQSALSLRAGTPYSHMSGRSAIQMPASWSEAAEEDLVCNLGPRERTRQEVLWEIVASEQRYVSELVKLKETFIDPLLHPYATSPITSTTAFNADPLVASEDIFNRSMSPTESIDHLPIASRFLSSPTPGSGPTSPLSKAGGKGNGESNQGRRVHAPPTGDTGFVDPQDEAEAADKMGKSYMGGFRNMLKDRRANSGGSNSSALSAGKGSPQNRSPYRIGAKTPTPPMVNGKGASNRSPSAAPARSHQSLPPPPRNPPDVTTGASRQSLTDVVNPQSKFNPPPYTSSAPSGTRKLHKQGPAGYDDHLVVPPHLLPDDLRICLEVLEGPTLKGHMTLCDGLRERYESQYPLVRSLADVFVAHSHILQGYATYVLHLERALEQVDNALATDGTKKPKNQDAADWTKVCRVLKRLEAVASDKGETGLAISLSKPFQRLLKYPLMFQNLLFHTDPSTYEYESTLQMVAEVEKIVRSIEDEKIQKEERDQTRDVFARIEGLEKVKMLAVPKPSRVLVEEKVFFGDDSVASEPGSRAVSPPTSTLINGPNLKNVKQKSSLKRFSDVLPGSSGKNGVGGKNDLWLVKFNDVVLRCQRTGTTSLPLVTGVVSGSSNGAGGRSNSLPDFTGNAKAKYATTGRRHAQVRPRNLYKFIKIETWVINPAKPRVGMISMEDISRSRSNVVAIEPVKSGDTDDEDGDSDDSDRKSKMSFSYWGADKITVDPVASAKARSAAVKAASRKGTPLAPVAYSRTESSARAKFGHRLRGAEEDDGPTSARNTAPKRGPSSSTQGTSRRAAAATDESGVSSKRAGGRTAEATSPSVASASRRLHNQSTTSSASAVASRAKVASTADSGVAVDWIDPSVHRL